MTIGSNGPLEEINKFGLKLRDWVESLLGLPELRKAIGWVPGVSVWFMFYDRYIRARDYLNDHRGLQFEAFKILANCIITGDLPDQDYAEPNLANLLSDPSQFVIDSLAFGMTTPVIQEPLQNIGGVIYDTSVATITGKLPPQNSEAAERARAFVGFVTALGSGPALLGSTIEAGSGGMIDSIGHNLQNVFWNLGLGFLTWQTMAPVLQAAILEPLTIDVQRQWRGKRFTRAEKQDLYALGKITRQELIEGLKDDGYRDSDIEAAIDLSYAPLGRGDIIQLWHKGIWTAEQAAEALRRNGIHPDNVELIMMLENKEDVANDKNESITILSTSFEDGLLPEADFREALNTQNYTDREIDLRVQLIRFKQQDKIRKLSVAQLHDAWAENVVGDQEVTFRLKEMGYAPTEIPIVLDTWKAQVQPAFIRVNQGSVLEMYRFGIFDRRTTLTKLQEIGYNSDDAEAQVALTEAKFPEAFGGAPPKKQRFLSLGAVTDLFSMGRLSEDDLRKWAAQSGFKDDDIESMTLLIKEQSKAAHRPLSQSTIESAYVMGIFDKQTATDALLALGFTLSDAQTELSVVEKRNPAVFAPETVKSIRQPTIGVLVTAVQAGFISEVEFFQKAALIGFAREGAQLYLDVARAQVTKGTKKLTKADVLEFFRKNLMDYPTAQKELIDMGYSARDADLLLRSEQKGVQATDIWNVFLSGFLSEDDTIVALFGLGFTEEQITEAFNSLQPAQEG